MLPQLEAATTIAVRDAVLVNDRSDQGLGELVVDRGAGRCGVTLDGEALWRDVELERHVAGGVRADEEMAQLGDGDPEIVDLLVVEPRTARRVRRRETCEPEVLRRRRDDERDALVSRHGDGTIPLRQRRECETRGLTVDREGKSRAMEFVLWVIAVILVVSGIVTMFRGQMGYGVLLIVVGLLVGPGGVSVFT